MVIVQLKGGLGNQLFQYATGRAIAHRNNVPLKLDVSKFESYPLRKYRLDHFDTVASIASPAEVARLTGSGQRGARAKAYSLIQRYLPYYRRSVLKEKHFHFDPNILRASGKVYLVGYWQSEKYFKDIEPILWQELTVKHRPDPANQAMSRLIHQTESVSLHIRRGDYVSNPITHEYHGVCSLDYYQAAVQTLTQTVEEPHFFVFSDDMEWARQNLRLDYPITFVTHNGVEKDYEDLRLMSQCKHHIIANSAFSWWGAWLNPNPDKIVFAPRHWLDDPRFDTRDVIPESWIKE